MTGAETALFDLGTFSITLAAPTTYDSPLQEYVKQRGDVPFEIKLRTSNPAKIGLLNLKQAHDARIELVS